MIENKGALDAFAYAEKVRLRNIDGKYLCAGDDVESIVFRKRCNQQDDATIVWEVKQVKGEVKLRSCYGGYLTGSQQRFLLGVRGNKVGQTRPTRADDLSDWEPVHQKQSQHEKLGAAGGFILLRSRAGTFLRANGGAPPWRNTVTHDHSSSDDDHNFLWEVEIAKEIGYE